MEEEEWYPLALVSDKPGSVTGPLLGSGSGGGDVGNTVGARHWRCCHHSITSNRSGVGMETRVGVGRTGTGVDTETGMAIGAGLGQGYGDGKGKRRGDDVCCWKLSAGSGYERRCARQRQK